MRNESLTLLLSAIIAYTLKNLRHTLMQVKMIFFRVEMCPYGLLLQTDLLHVKFCHF